MKSAQLNNGEVLSYSEHNLAMKNLKPTLLFIHGNFSSHIWWYDIIQSLLPSIRHMIAVDLRGFGASTYMQPCHYFGDWANDVKYLCELLQIKSIVAIGMSFGGGVTMRLAQLAPTLVTKMILTSSVSHFGLILKQKGSDCKTIETIYANDKYRFMFDLLASKNAYAMRQVYDTIIFTKMMDYPEAKKVKLIETAFYQRCYRYLLFALANSDIDSSQMFTETLMLHGDYDKVVTLDSVQYTGKILKSLYVWQGHAHMLPFENQNRYVERLSQYIT